MRDSWTGYLLPARDAPRALPDGQSSCDAVAAAASCQNVTLISFSFRAWIGVIWEISARNRRQISSFSGARLFCKDIKSQNSSIYIYTILRFFRIHIPKMDSFPMLFSHPTQSPVRLSAPHGSQIIKLVGFPVFPGSQVIKLVLFPVFPGSKLNENDWFSSISRFKTE